MRRNRQLPQFIRRVGWILLCLHFSRINITQYQSIMCFNLNTVDKSSSVYKAFFFKAFLCFFFSNINGSYVYAARTKLVSLKSCLLFVQKSIGLYMEILYLCIQINLNTFLTHTFCAEVSYIILSGGSTSKILSTVTWKRKILVITVLCFIYIHGI